MRMMPGNLWRMGRMFLDGEQCKKEGKYDELDGIFAVRFDKR